MLGKLFGVGALSTAKFADLVAEIGVANGTLRDLDAQEVEARRSSSISAARDYAH